MRSMRWTTRLAVFGLWGFILLLIVIIAFLPAPAERTFVSSSGYTLKYPGDWITIQASGRDSSFESELIREPRGHATISIAEHQEPRLSDEAGRVAVSHEIEGNFERDPDYRLNFFGWLNPDVTSAYNGYVATGVFTVGSTQYNFREIGMLDPDGSKVTFRREVRAEFEPLLGGIADAVLLSIQGGLATREISKKLLTADEARIRIAELPEVALYRASAKESGFSYILRVDDAGPQWYVQMLGAGANGASTPVLLGRWRVDKATGAISKVVP